MVKLMAAEEFGLGDVRERGNQNRGGAALAMLNLEKIKIEYCMNQIRSAYRRNYSDMEKELGNIIVWSSHLALENIANTDALYHNVEHTVLVALAGQAILEGKHLSEGGITPRDLGTLHDSAPVP